MNDSLIHVDLLELVDDKSNCEYSPEIRRCFSGVKDGGKLVIKMKSLKVKTYPKYLKNTLK